MIPSQISPLLLILLILLSLLIGSTLSQNVYAQFYEGHSEGWHWYENPREEREELEEVEVKESKRENKKESKKESKKEEASSNDPVVQMKVLRETIERALDKAILQPTDSNVKNYIALQNRLSNQSTLFANVWQKVLLENPSLDYALIHPTNTLAKQVDLDLQHKKEDAAIAKLAKESGLFFFYSSSCAYCHKFAPILKSFSSDYKISIIPITLDGRFLPEYPDSKVNKGQAARFNVTVLPSLFAVNPYTGKVYPISQGLISQYDLRKRILDISQNFAGGS